MSLDTVVEDIRDEARKRREEILAEAEERADEIVAAAEADAEETVAAAEERAESEADQERERAISSAKLEAKQQRLEARREALSDVRERVEAAVAGIDGDEREELTRALLDAAATEFEEGDDVRVYARPEDEELVASLVADREGYDLAGEVDCLGGVVVESERSRVRVNNTFDSVLDEVWEDSLKDVSSQLFDQ